MNIGAVRSEEVCQGTQRGDRGDRDKKFHLALRSQIERSQGAPCENDARR